MAKAEIKLGSHQTLKMRVRIIISAEKDEIDWMQSWLKTNRFGQKRILLLQTDIRYD